MHCKKHKGVSPFFFEHEDTNSWTFNNLSRWMQCDNANGEVQNLYKNSLIYIQKVCERKCFTETQRANAERVLTEFNSDVSNSNYLALFVTTPCELRNF